MDFKEVNQSRRSTRNYDPNFNISRPVLEELLNQAALSPSSANMQGTQVIVITASDLKKDLKPICCNQQQVVDASAVLVMLGNLHAHKKLRFILEQTASLPKDRVDYFVKDAESIYEENLQMQRDEALRTASLFSMTFMLAAANLGFDTCPIIGFDEKRLCEKLQIEKPYFPALMITLGKSTKVPFPRAFRVPAADFSDFR